MDSPTDIVRQLSSIKVERVAPSTEDDGFRRAPALPSTVITRTWRSGFQVFQLVGALIVFVLFSVGLVRSDNLISLFFFGLFVLGTAYWLYTRVAYVFNRSKLVVSVEGMDIQHGPIPWPGNKRVAAADVEEVVIRHTQSRRENSYCVVLSLRNGKELTLCDELGEEDHAVALEEEIAKALGLKS